MKLARRETRVSARPGAMSTAVINVNELWKSYPMGKTRRPVLKGIALRIDAGEYVSIVGSSGSGKSTLLNVLGLLDQFDSGSFSLSGHDVHGLSDRQAAHLRNQYIGFVFQSFHLIGHKSALENVQLPLQYRRMKNRERRDRAVQVLERVGLADRMHHLPSELSGGQKQRVAIARALVTEPSLLLADEPTGALDSVTSSAIMDLMEALVDEGRTLVVVTHELEIAARTHRVITLKDGVVERDDRSRSLP